VTARTGLADCATASSSPTWPTELPMREMVRAVHKVPKRRLRRSKAPFSGGEVTVDQPR
jgi:hypothetical protein